jgi:hypothetical protein
LNAVAAFSLSGSAILLITGAPDFIFSVQGCSIGSFDPARHDVCIEDFAEGGNIGHSAPAGFGIG